jgi:hypothetical protein
MELKTTILFVWRFVCRLNPEDEGNSMLRNVGNTLPVTQPYFIDSSALPLAAAVRRAVEMTVAVWCGVLLDW